MANRSDNFNRADGALNGSTPSDGGSVWVCTNGGTVNGNAFRHGGGGGATSEYNTLEASSADVDVTATITTLPSAFGRVGLLVRGSDQSNFWWGEARAGSTPTTAGTWTIQKRVAGTNSSVVSGTGAALGVGSILRVNAVGDQIRLYHTPSGGSESLILDTGTGQTHNQTATKHGFGGSFEDPNARMDDLSIVDLAAPPSGNRRRRVILGVAA
jgi:hypothetical protein